MAGLGGLGRGQDVAEGHHHTVLVGYLDADGLLAGNWRQDPNVSSG